MALEKIAANKKYQSFCVPVEYLKLYSIGTHMKTGVRMMYELKGELNHLHWKADVHSLYRCKSISKLQEGNMTLPVIVACVVGATTYWFLSARRKSK